ncbi:MAG: response regulator transcription factor [Marinifilaceae bacterium]|nr:response regulator transcription factor [Marinifilaceae bacterium]
MKKRKVVLGEESQIVALGFSKVMEGSSLFEVVDDAGRIDKLQQKIVTCKPDVVVVNPTMEGVVKGDTITTLFEETPVVALAYSYIEQSILKQFRGTIDINDSRQEIENKLKEALAKESTKEEKNNYELSDRETDVLIAVARGMQNKEIADSLNISPHTVITHRKNIVAKTGIKSVAGLTVYALINNLISESDVM